MVFFFLSLLLVGVAKDRLLLGFLSLVGVAKDRLLLAVALFQRGSLCHSNEIVFRFFGWWLILFGT